MRSKFEHRRLYLIAGVIAVVLILGFAVSAPKLTEVGAPAQNLALVASTTPLVYLHDAYRKGTHTITGEVLVPDACTSVNATASLTGDASSSSAILISLDIPPDTGVCLEEPATTTFTTTITAPAGSSLTASINGSDASTSSY